MAGRGAPTLLPTLPSASPLRRTIRPRNKKARHRQKPRPLTKEEFDSIKPAPIKKKLKDIVHEHNCQVDANWHDGYEQQAETNGEWFEAIYFPLQNGARHWREGEFGPGPVQRILKIVSDLYYNLLTVSMPLQQNR